MGENGNGLPKGGLLLKDDQRQVENEQNGKFTNGHNNSEKLKNAPEKPIIDEQSSDSLKGRKLFQYLATFTGEDIIIIMLYSCYCLNRTFCFFFLLSVCEE